MSDHDAYRTALGEKRDVQRGANTHSPSDLLVHLGIFQDGVDALATSALEHASGLRGSELEFDADEAVCVGTLAIGRGDAQTLASSLGESDENEPGVDEIAQPSCDQAEEGLELELAGERVSDLAERLEVAQPAVRRLVEPRVLDRNRGLGGKQPRELLVLVAETPAALLLGQIQVSVGDSTKQDRHPEEGLHRWVVFRKTDRTRVVGEVVEPQWLGVADQHSEDPASARHVADRGISLGVDARRHEALEGYPRLVDHAERCVARAGQLRCRLDELLQKRLQRKLGAECDSGVDEHTQAIWRSLLRHVPSSVELWLEVTVLGTVILRKRTRAGRRCRIDLVSRTSEDVRDGADHRRRSP